MGRSGGGVPFPGPQAALLRVDKARTYQIVPLATKKTLFHGAPPKSRPVSASSASPSHTLEVFISFAFLSLPARAPESRLSSCYFCNRKELLAGQVAADRSDVRCQFSRGQSKFGPTVVQRSRPTRLNLFLRAKPSACKGKGAGGEIGSSQPSPARKRAVNTSIRKKSSQVPGGSG